LRVLSGESIAGEGSLSPIVRSAVLKNRIDRGTATTGGREGGLFSFDEEHWPSITIYALIADEFVETARELFIHLALTGYGKRKSVGYGNVRLRSFEPYDGLPASENPNAFASLSSFVPACGDPVTGYWRTRVKYGKLGEELAVSGNPFKRPFVQLTAGSVFFDSPVRPWYGRMVSGLSPSHPEVMQYGLALAMPIRLVSETAR
jgi:CRISPR-associated protein Csm4